MVATVRLFALVAVLLGIASANPYLVVVEAEKNNPKKSGKLSNGFKFCASTFAPKISIECVAPGAGSASFFVNGGWVKNEGVAPYMIAGDRIGYSYPWTVPTGRVTIQCKAGSSEVTVYGEFTCGNSNPTPAAPTPTSTPKPSNAPVTPFTNPAEQKIGVNRKYCVLIPATSHTNERPKDWVLQDDGISLTFRPNDSFGGALPPSTAKLYYTFEVPIAAYYGFSMASRTIHNTEHNDIWITFPDGMSLIRVENDKIVDRQDGLTGPLKSYHGQPNRYTQVAMSVDHREHTFCSTNKLVPGRKYTIIVGARSTKFQLYGLIAFPAAGTQCWIWGDWFATKYLPTCRLV